MFLVIEMWGYGDNRKASMQDIKEYGDYPVRSGPAPKSKVRQPQHQSAPQPQRRTVTVCPSTSPRSSQQLNWHQIDHTFDFGGAFKLGLGFGLGIMIAVPVGLVVVSILFTVFGATLVGFLNGLG